MAKLDAQVDQTAKILAIYIINRFKGYTKGMCLIYLNMLLNKMKQ